MSNCASGPALAADYSYSLTPAHASLSTGSGSRVCSVPAGCMTSEFIVWLLEGDLVWRSWRVAAHAQPLGECIPPPSLGCGARALDAELAATCALVAAAGRAVCFSKTLYYTHILVKRGRHTASWKWHTL